MDNHGLLELRGMPTWRTVTGGSQQYVRALTARLSKPVRINSAVTKVVRTADAERPLGAAVEVVTAAHGPDTFDAVILAGHSDQSLELLGDPTPAERQVLGAIRYQPNLATLHTDSRLLPRQPRARASWNYHLGTGSGREATLTYWMNNLQGIESSHDFLVTLNRAEEIDRTTVLAEFEYDHPVFDAAAMAAQRRRPEIQGAHGTFFAGAYWGYGFHEDGVVSALDVCRHFGTGL
jgi:predicted NAD/FAD-binding protein